ncbi:hypothetical protein OQA88_8342 [Cercophora sp. LCS_1]
MSTILTLLGVIVLTATLYHLLHALYNLYLHPLSHIPGPILWRASHLPYIYHLATNTLPVKVLPLHTKYGPVIRIAPDQLAFTDPSAWRDIYGGGTHKGLPKWPTMYRTAGAPPSILGEDDTNHALLRRTIAPQFSERAMREQEGIITKYVDLLIRQLRNVAVDTDTKDAVTGGEKGRTVDIVRWYNWTTFDIIGDLAFGEPFGSLERGKEDGWVTALSKGLDWGPVIIALKMLGMWGFVGRVLVPLMKSRRAHLERTKEKLGRRMEVKGGRPDLIEGWLGKREEWNMGLDRLNMNASTLIGAGSETTATLLSGVTYFLLKNPEAMKKVTDEVRSTFKTEDEINFTSVNGLDYMLACLNEAMRRYPPTPFGMPRQVPKGTGSVSIAGVDVPEDVSSPWATHERAKTRLRLTQRNKTVVSIFTWATYHSEENFTDPFGFHPERFMHDPKFAGDRLEAFQPFSAGPRNCVGRNLAYVEMRIILAKVLFNFDIILADEDTDWLDQKVHLLWVKIPLLVQLVPVTR